MTGPENSNLEVIEKSETSFNLFQASSGHCRSGNLFRNVRFVHHEPDA